MNIEDAAVPCGPCRLCCQEHNLVPLAPELGDEPAGYQTQTVKVGGVATQEIFEAGRRLVQQGT